MTHSLHLTLLALSWAVYGALHSVLAGSALKRALQTRFPLHYRYYRLTYNLLAAILLIAPLWLLKSYSGTLLWHWPTALGWVANSAAGLAVLGFAWSLRYYDNGEFLGTRQLRGTAAGPYDQAPLKLSPLHRWVRHPWYFFGLVILWTREMNAALLVTAITLTLYLVIGSRLEESKLIATYGNAYRDYRNKVPGLLPLPWRHLSAAEAERIVRQSERQTPA